MDRLLLIVFGAVATAVFFSGTAFIIAFLFDSHAFFDAATWLFWFGAAIGAFNGLTLYEEQI